MMFLILMTGSKRMLRNITHALGSQLYIGASKGYHGDDAKQLHRIYQLAEKVPNSDGGHQ